MQTLTLRDVVTAARKAYEANKLGAQHTDTCQYIYRDEDGVVQDYSCAVGAALSEETRKKLLKLNGDTFEILMERSIRFIHDQDHDGTKAPFQADKADELPIAMLQAIHDMWATHSRLSNVATEDEHPSNKFMIPISKLLPEDLRLALPPLETRRVEEADFVRFLAACEKYLGI